MKAARAIGRYVQIAYLLVWRFFEALFSPGMHPNPSKLELWLHQSKVKRPTEVDIEGFGKNLRAAEAFRRRVEAEIASWREEESLIVARCINELDHLALTKKESVQNDLNVIRLKVVRESDVEPDEDQRAVSA